jgi:hypothetical protein
MSCDLSFTPSDICLRKYCVVVPTFEERMSTLYHSTADTELCERSIMRVNTRLKNNQTLRAVVKRGVNKQNKLGLQSVVELYEAVSRFGTQIGTSICQPK